MVVAIEDGESQRDRRLLPGRPAPDQYLPWAQPVGGQCASAFQPDFTRCDATAPRVLVGVPITVGQVPEDGLTRDLRTHLLAILETGVQRLPV
jgi:hypothetical protein